MNKINEILGLDVGTKKIGVARANMVAKIPEPLSPVATNLALKELPQIIAQQKSQAIVVGLPRNLSSEDTAQTKWVRDWVEQAKKAINLPFYWQDEALSTLAATTVHGKLKKQASVSLDSLAACVILEDFMAVQANGWVKC